MKFWLPILILGSLIGGCSQPQANAELKPSRIYDLGKPATVLIETDYRAEIQVPEVGLNQAEMDALGQRAAEAVQSGALPADRDVITQEVLKEMLSNWRRYLVAGTNMRPIMATMSGVGSGFFITSDGYVITNAHVVVPDENELKQGLVNNALAQLVEQDVQDFASALGGNATPPMIDQLRQAAVEFYVENMKIGEQERRIQVFVGAGDAGSSTPKGLDAEIVEKGTGTPIPGKDVALLKVSGSNFPTLSLGEDEGLTTGDKLFVVGYPAAATFMPDFKPESITESTLTTGVLSRKVTMKDGWTVLQTDAAVSGGNSGGPAINEKGQVIGLATFVSVDPESGKPVEGLHFVVPSAIIKEKLRAADVSPKDSETTIWFREALGNMDRDYYKPALAQLNQIKEKLPDQPWVAKQISACEKAIAEGKDQSWRGNLPLYIGGGVAAIVATIFAINAMMRSRKSGAPPAQQPPVESQG